jgi:hypothetical protein
MGRGVSARLQTAVATVYPKCGANFRAVGCCVCSADYPSGMADIGVSRTRKSYRIASKIRAAFSSVTRSS